MWLQRFLWPDIAMLCSGDERGEKTVDRAAEDEYTQKQGKRDLFFNATTTLPASGRVALPTEIFSGSAGRPLCPSRVPKPSKWQHYCIMPGSVKRNDPHRNSLFGAYPQAARYQ